MFAPSMCERGEGHKTGLAYEPLYLPFSVPLCLCACQCICLDLSLVSLLWVRHVGGSPQLQYGIGVLFDSKQHAAINFPFRQDYAV